MNLKQIITDLKAQGKTIPEIAQFTGRTVPSINYYIKKFDLSKPHKGYSHVFRNRKAGGTLVIRISKQLHKKLADMCEANNESINGCVTRLIQEAVK